MKWEEQYQRYGQYILFYFVCIALVVCGIAVYQEKKGKEALEEARSNPYFTEEHLTWGEMDVLTDYFRMESHPNFKQEIEECPGPDFSYVEIKPTKETEKAVVVINYLLFDRCLELDLNGKAYAEECGLSYRNRMTLDWVITHKHEAAKILEHSLGIILNYKDSAQSSVYDLITGDAIYTEYHLSYVEIASLWNWFDIETTPDYGVTEKEYLNEGRTDFTDMTLEASEYTHKVAAVMNYILFEEASEKDAKAIQIAKECGLSKENPLTAEWILTHPKEAMEIKNGMENYGEIIYDQEKILEKYEEIE